MTRFITAILFALIALPQAFAAERNEHETREPNRLIKEASPYLRQHAYNPIKWFPWGPEAFAKAKKENKPIFLSVGYSTCHWCHVMERESFNEEDIAEVLNLNYVAIKVDRERRPDVDETYMLATQLITERGGWPNNVFLTPERKPFYAGTYFPRDTFKTLLIEVAKLWDSEPDALKQDAERIAGTVSTIMTRRVEASEVTPEKLNAAAQTILKGVDDFNGGFTDAPKFPQESILLFLLRLAEKDGTKELLDTVTLTLDNILDGGIHDHAGGGFHRYAVDPQWRIPHFEKMLYNQALITRALLRAHRLTGKTRYAAAARRALDYVIADMTSPQGGFYSARDADSEGEEGTFYVWTPAQLEKALDAKDADFAKKVFGVTVLGNFESQTTVLHFPASPKELAETLKMSEDTLMQRANAIRAKLAKARQSRKAPHRDEKIVTAWNGMMIATFAEAAEMFDDQRYRNAALNAANFLWNEVGGKDALKRAWFEGRAALDAQQEDYAFTALGFVALYDLTGDALWLKRAETLTAQMVKLFRDDTAGDYYMTASVSTFSKAKARTDAGTPSGNAAALELFAKLARRSQKPDHRLNGEALLSALSSIALRSPLSNSYALLGADLLLRGGAGARQYMSKGIVDVDGSIDKADGALKLSLRIAPGWHINSDKPLEEFFIPTEVKLEGSEAAKVAYPAAVRRKLGFHEKELALYEGKVEITAKLPEGVEMPVNATLRLQACSDEICLEPETAKVTVRN